MEMVKAAGFALVAAVLITLLKQYAPAYAVLALAACSLAFWALFARYVQPVLSWLSGLSGLVDRQEFLCLVRAAGVALIAQTMQELCRDAGMNSLAASVELAGRCLVLTAALPLFQMLLEQLTAVLQ